MQNPPIFVQHFTHLGESLASRLDIDHADIIRFHGKDRDARDVQDMFPFSVLDGVGRGVVARSWLLVGKFPDFVRVWNHRSNFVRRRTNRKNELHRSEGQLGVLPMTR